MIDRNATVDQIERLLESYTKTMSAVRISEYTLSNILEAANSLAKELQTDIQSSKETD